MPVFATPLTRNGRFDDAASTPNALNSQFFKDLPSEIVGFGVHFSYLAIPARAFFGDLPHNSFISLWVFFTPIRGIFYGLSWAILGPSWGRLSVPRRGPCTSRCLEPKFGVQYSRRRLLATPGGSSASARGRCEIVMLGMCTRGY